MAVKQLSVYELCPNGKEQDAEKMKTIYTIFYWLIWIYVFGSVLCFMFSCKTLFLDHVISLEGSHSAGDWLHSGKPDL